MEKVEWLIGWMDHHPGPPAYLQAILVPAAVLATLWAAVIPLSRLRKAEQQRLARVTLTAARRLEQILEIMLHDLTDPHPENVKTSWNLKILYREAERAFSRCAIEQITDDNVYRSAIDMLGIFEDSRIVSSYSDQAASNLNSRPEWVGWLEVALKRTSKAVGHLEIITKRKEPRVTFGEGRSKDG